MQHVTLIWDILNRLTPIYMAQILPIAGTMKPLKDVVDRTVVTMILHGQINVILIILFVAHKVVMV
tara:strand:+ start:24 stop:221 length:198 start_codon:yes stop_codon:yes gene_type:complete